MIVSYNVLARLLCAVQAESPGNKEIKYEFNCVHPDSVNDFARMRKQLERLIFQIRQGQRYRNVVHVAAFCGVIAALAMSCGPASDLISSNDKKIDKNIPLPRTTPVIRATPTLAAQDPALTLTSPSEEINPLPTEAKDDLQRLTVTAQPLAMEPYLGMWLTREELNRLPMSGPAWENLKGAANKDPGLPDLSNQSQLNNVYILAKALVYARTGDPLYRDQVVLNLMAAPGTEQGGRTLALGRELVAYIVAADLINLPADPDKDRIFRDWLRRTYEELLDGRTLQMTHETRPNNWGTHAGASRAAIAIYLQDEAELDRTARIFMGYLGNRDIYDGFEFGKLWWQSDKNNPVGINPVGATMDGHSIDGALPEEMRRGGKFRWPPKETGYPWEALQGALVQAELLHRAGYLTWEWEDRALLRAAQFLYDIGWPPEGDDEWLPSLINYAYGTECSSSTPVRPGKNMGWTDWSHSRSRFSE